MNLAQHKDKLPDALDVAVLLGASLIVYGTRLIYPPAAFIIAGIFLLIGSGLIIAKRKGGIKP